MIVEESFHVAWQPFLPIAAFQGAVMLSKLNLKSNFMKVAIFILLLSFFLFGGFNLFQKTAANTFPRY